MKCSRYYFQILHFLRFILIFLIIYNSYSFGELNEGIQLFKNDHFKVNLIEDNFNLEVVNSDNDLIFAFNDKIKFNADNIIVIENVLKLNYTDSNKVEICTRLSNNDSLKILLSFDNNLSLLKFKTEPIGNDIKSIFCSNKLFDVEEIYGFGETWNESVAQRGKTVEVWNKNGTPDECAYIPYYVSTQNYAFWIDYGGRVNFDIGQSNSTKISYEIYSKELNFNLLLSNSVANVVKSYTKITGLPIKPPRWAFKPWAWLMHDPEKPGSHISTLKGHHLIEMAKKFKELDIPIGVTWMEPPWQTNRTSFIPNKEFSSDLKSTIDSLESLDVKTLAWTVPYTSGEAPNWEIARDNNFIVANPNKLQNDGKIKLTNSGEVEGKSYNYIDFTNIQAVEWWKKEIQKAINLGFVGFKLDAGQSLEDDAILTNNVLGSDVHNSYGLYYNKVFYKVLSENYGDQFLTIPRAGYIGSASYSNFKWPGDLSATFGKNGLPSSIYSTLSASLSGFSFLSTDIGGFEGRPASEEVWIRWAQFGSMLPGMETLNMPWWYSKKAIEHYKYLSWLHTNLIPYWNSLGNQSKTEGTPVCRPLIWDYQSDINTWRINDQYTIGEYILVAPIIEKNSSRDVYLPEGEWFDFWDDSLKYTGNKNYKWFKGWEESKWKFPLYIKAGAIIPMEIINDITSFGWEEFKDYLTIAIWPKENGSSSYTIKDREEINISVESLGNNIFINISQYQIDCLLRIHLIKSKIPKTIKKNSNVIDHENSLDKFLDNDEDCWYYDIDSKKIFIKTNHSPDSSKIIIRFDK